jgi:hypothetical protein
MVDTIGITLGYEVSQFEKLELKNIQCIVNRDTGEQVGLRGIFVENFNIYYSYGSLKIIGSLSRFLTGTNYNILTYNQLIEAFNKLGKLLNIDLNNAQIHRLDFAENLQMRSKSKAWFHYLGPSKFYKRFIEGNTIYYNSGNRKMAFYNKNLESKSKNNVNILRFETRWLKPYLNSWTKKELTKEYLQVDDLLKPIIFNKLLKLWEKEYGSILKNNSLLIDFSIANTPKNVENQLILFAINKLGGFNNVIRLIELSKAESPFLRPETFSRIKKGLYRLSSLENLTRKSEFILMLDDEVKKAVIRNLVIRL